MKQLDSYLYDVEYKTNQLYAFQKRSLEAKTEVELIKNKLESGISYLENKTRKQQDRMQDTIKKMIQVVDQQQANPELLNVVLQAETYKFDTMFNKIKKLSSSVDHIVNNDNDDDDYDFDLLSQKDDSISIPSTSTGNFIEDDMKLKVALKFKQCVINPELAHFKSLARKSELPLNIIKETSLEENQPLLSSSNKRNKKNLSRLRRRRSFKIIFKR